ncbi:hypothetical protein F5Y16DRAFT_385515 [Xylariaceae sp. FL0255]|nr:hypothetical protein F5Y16DRAFT_385515 [Xylariaceae sp. FL0255]
MSSRLLLNSTRRPLQFLSRPVNINQRSKRLLILGGAATTAAGTGAAIASHSQAFSLSSLFPKIHLDSSRTTTSSSSSSPLSPGSHAFSSSEYDNKIASKNGGLDPELLKQLSGGSVTGLLAGLLVSVFSRTLVLLFGLSVVVVQVAARYGINIVDQLRLKQRLGNKSRIIAALEKDPAFKVTFGAFFALSAFMQF